MEKSEDINKRQVNSPYRILESQEMEAPSVPEGSFWFKTKNKRLDWKSL